MTIVLFSQSCLVSVVHRIVIGVKWLVNYFHSFDREYLGWIQREICVEVTIAGAGLFSVDYY